MNRRSHVFTIIALFVLNAPAKQIAHKISHGETCTYVKTQKNGIALQFKLSFWVEEAGNNTIIGYKNDHPVAQWTVASYPDGRPRRIEFVPQDNRHSHLVLHFLEEGVLRMQGIWRGERINMTRTFSPYVSLENLMYLRTMDFAKKKLHSFEVLRVDKLPRLVSYRMYYRVDGEETVTVRAGTFACWKILFTCENKLLSKFYKSYFYVSKDKHQYLVKEENQTRDFVVELDKVE